MIRRARCVVLAAGVAIALGACESAPEMRERPRAQVPEMNGAARAVSTPIARVGGPVEMYGSATVVHRQRLDGARAGAERVEPAIVEGAPGETRRIKYTVRDASAEDVVRVLVGEFMGRSYVVDPEFNGRGQSGRGVTLDVDEEMTQQDLGDLLGALAALHGWSVEEHGDVLVIGQAAKMSRSARTPIMEARAAFPNDQTGVRVFRMNHISATEAADALKELISDGAKSVVSGRTLVVVDRVRQLNRIGQIIRSLDVPAFGGAEIWTYQLAFESAAEAVKTLTALAQATRLSAATDTQVAFVPLAKANRLMVITRDPSMQPMLRSWIGEIDRPPDRPARMLSKYHIQHFDPAKLGTLLSKTFEERLEVNSKDPSDPGIRFVVDAEEDLLIVNAMPRDFADVFSFLSSVDVPRQQVMLESVIAEVTLTDTLQFGVEYFLQREIDGDILEFAGNLTTLGPAIATGSAFFLSDNGFAVIKALQQNTNVQIISTPKLVTRDKDLAAFQVGARVPILRATLDSSTQQGGTTGIRNEVEYEETGVILTLQPKITESGDVTIRITQEITDAVPNVTSGIDSPAFTKRKVETTVIVPHGKTLLLAGIINTRDTDRLGQIPILGNIPIIGKAFQNINRSRERTELLLAITPTVINDVGAVATTMVGDFLASAYGVEAALRQFDAALPDAYVRTGARDGVMIYQRGEEAPPALEPAIDDDDDAPGGAEAAPEAAPTDRPRRPAPAGAAVSLRTLAAQLPDDAGGPTMAVAMFLNELSSRVPSEMTR